MVKLNAQGAYEALTKLQQSEIQVEIYGQPFMGWEWRIGTKLKEGYTAESSGPLPDYLEAVSELAHSAAENFPESFFSEWYSIRQPEHSKPQDPPLEFRGYRGDYADYINK